ncbi:MAG TPA: aminotransferase class I/II-fold pyridoxal phosphate-dependent enzyme [candidate division Zixibacteria bacterium]|nr:aminotransferase class I/II-fold pyridoxal phosphate-dependent enzyme [candidate division Zixibacteria bacterium]MDD4917447.1 aminotransferase class I/II-fold pyridoxal phosphate-dependent enzyme [candidate division Zixibacteria bacterium]HOD67320.1 aminotransferase class I/II-fold pyridoxal phosphate-dependent enzyme [candidate division Zixibacteria bacterium]HPI33563.1 aminotransferase class I/II-fold pyridoxal phosphate-dependent enzyme [candidate division Zixibacteria bacterium]HPM36623.
MNTLQDTPTTDRSDLLEAIAQRTMTSPSMVHPFAAAGPFLAGLLGALYRPGCRLQAIGHVTPEVELAADRAEVEVIEHIGPSPFSGSLQTALQGTVLPHDILCAANPNRVTGANYSLADVQRMAETVPEGAVLVDEHYHDYFGITALPLLSDCPNVIILRSFAPGGALGGDEPGYALACPRTIARLRAALPESVLPAAEARLLIDRWPGGEALAARLREGHQESLRLAEGLTRLGVQCRLSATDFILLRVADPARVGNHLSRARIAIDNLDGYPAMQHYLRYRVQSPLSNDRLLQAFQAMPPESFRMKTIDGRVMTMRLSAQAARKGAGRSGNLLMAALRDTE